LFITAPDRIQIACFRDTSQFEETLGDFTSTFDANNPVEVIVQCAVLAYGQNYRYFAVGNNGICYSGPNTKQRYWQNQDWPYASANDCLNGVGSENFVFVYTFGE